MANLIEREFVIAFGGSDERESIIPAIRRRVADLEKNFCMKGPFVLRMPAVWKSNLLQEYFTTSKFIIEAILEERIKGIEFVPPDKSNGTFALVWRVLDIRRRS